MTATTVPLPPVLAALERARAAWEKAGRPGPGSRQLTIDRLLEEAPGPQLTGAGGRGTGVSSSGPFPLDPYPGGRSTTYDGGDTAQILGRTARGVPAEGA